MYTVYPYHGKITGSRVGLPPAHTRKTIVSGLVKKNNLNLRKKTRAYTVSPMEGMQRYKCGLCARLMLLFFKPDTLYCSNTYTLLHMYQARFLIYAKNQIIFKTLCRLCT